MTLSRPRLVLLPGESPLDATLIDWLKTAFDVVQIDDPAALEQMAEEDADALIVCTPQRLRELSQAVAPESAASALQA